MNLITAVELETVTLPVKLQGSVSTPLPLRIYSLDRAWQSTLGKLQNPRGAESYFVKGNM